MKTLLPLMMLLMALIFTGCASQPEAADPTPAPTPEPTDMPAPTGAPAPTGMPEPTDIPAPTEAPAPETAAYELVRTIELPFIPHDIALAPDGSLYAVELGAPMVHHFDREGNLLASWGGAGDGEGQFAFDPPPDGPPLDGGFVVVAPDGRVFVSDSYNNRVQVFDASGAFLEMWTSYGPDNAPFMNPGPISVDVEGNIYVSDFGGTHQFDASGNYIQSLQSAGELAIDGQGNVFTVVAFQNIAMKIPAGGGEPVVWGGEGVEDGLFITPMWVVLGPDDVVYIADHSGRLQAFDAEGNFLSAWSDPGNGDGPLAAPGALAIDSDGQIFVAPKDRSTVYVLRP